MTTSSGRHCRCSTRTATRAIALALIESIEDTGYLTEAVEDIATRLGTDPADVEAILAIIQQSEPTGVGARTLAECLALQLKDKTATTPPWRARRQSRPPGAAGVRAAPPHLPRRRGGSRRHGQRDSPARPEARSDLRRRARPRRGARRLRPPGAGRQLDGGAQRRRAASRHRQPQLLRARLSHQGSRRQELHRRGLGHRQLADPQPGAARPHDPEGRERDRAPAGFVVLHVRRAAPAAAEPQDDRGSGLRCTNRPSPALPRTSTWRRPVACSR